MSDYTELRARLKHDCMCDRETMYQCDYCTASYAIESQAREITELRTWRDEAVRLCAKRNCAGRDRRIRDLEEDNDALRARAEAAEKAIRDHNDGCVAACEARQRGDYGQDCSAWISRKKRCLDCARDSMIDYGSEMFHVKHSQTNQEGL